MKTVFDQGVTMRSIKHNFGKQQDSVGNIRLSNLSWRKATNLVDGFPRSCHMVIEIYEPDIFTRHDFAS